jgi:hypothetical protein
MCNSEIINILIICDSHGTNYGVEKSYTEIIKQKFDGKQYYINVIGLGGIKIETALKKVLLDNKLYDYVIIQYGNSDMHPRIRYEILHRLSRLNHFLGRDGLYTLPPKIGVRYFLKIPFFVCRRVFLLSGHRIQTSYADFIKTIKIIVAKYEHSKIYIFPLFNVHSFVYGRIHNKNVCIINEILEKQFPEIIIKDNLLKENVYKKFYNNDYFHFKQEYHYLLANILLERINGESAIF